MATHIQRATPELEAPPWRHTDGLNAKLAALKRLGLDVQWIEASRDDLTRLVIEGGEAAIRLDTDPGVDRAWYGEVEIRHNAAREGTWVFVKGEVSSGEVSAHVVEPPGAA
jgi:uncharacterized protein YuzB (UPF0349 family)